MIENKLSQHELSRVLRPFLRLETISTILPTLQDVLGFPIQTRIDDRNAVLYQEKVLLTFEGYRMDIRDLRQTAPGAASIIIQFRAEKKWWHGLFRDQNAGVVRALQNICRAEIVNLAFTRFETTIPTHRFMDDGPQNLVFLHDSSAFNREWKAGYDVSPLLICPDCHDGKCFVEFQFNSAAYRRSGPTTALKDDWLTTAFAVSNGIERTAKNILGLD
jgi:hypothetical protein